MSAPPLRRQDIETKLNELFSRNRERGRRLFAFHGEGQEERIVHEHAGPVDIVPVRSELDLRAHLPPFGSEQVTVFLVPWTGKLPLDIGGRFHHSGTIEPIGKSEQLKRMFAAAEVDEAARTSPLATYLLRPEGPAHIAYGQSRLTHDGMWTTWLKHAFGWPVEGGLALDALLGFAAMDARGPSRMEELRASNGEAVISALAEHLRTRVGLGAELAFVAWSEARGRSLLEVSLLFSTLASAEDAAARMWTKLQAKQELGIDRADEALSVARALGEAAPRALRYVAARSEPHEVRSIIESADRRLDDDDLRRLLVDDPRLPAGWALRLERLGRLLGEAANKPDAALVREIDRARRDLEGHGLAREADKLPIQRRAEMACRLAAWLAATPEEWPEPAMTKHGDVDVVATWYAKEGGYVDWARRGARGTRENVFGQGVQALVEKVGARRRKLDHRFARALAAWNEANQPSHHVLPIHQAVKRIAVSYLKQHDERRLLVLLVDGMAWAQAVEILSDLGTRPTLWGPLAWHQGQGRIGESVYPAVLASLPTITKVSRSAFFAGKEVKPHTQVSSDQDIDRWATHSDVLGLVERPRLQLRGESHTADGSASSAALQLVGDVSQRIVAIVINAIDASLKGDTQQRSSWTVDTIASLADLLDKAREAGRTVLFCSDHGHVPSDDVTIRTSAAGGGGRWRPIESGEALQPYEVAFSGSHVWLPPGKHDALALIADDTARYGGGAPLGDHGGAALAEVVAPCLLIGCEDALVDDPARAVRPLAAPPWWHLDVLGRDATSDRPEPERRKKTRKTEKKDDAQLTLPDVIPPSVEKEPGEKELGEKEVVELPLAGSELFRKRVELAHAKSSEILAAAAYLLERNGVAPAAAFASALGKHATRVEGFVATLGEVLNVDGYPVITFDYTSRQVRLDRGKLAMLFEIEL